MFVVLGTTTVDLFVSGMDGMPRFDGDEFTSSSLAFCKQPLTMTLGGNGANSAYVLASLGAKTALCSTIGQDDLGKLVTGWLSAKGIDLRGLQCKADAGTPTTTAIVDGQLNRLSFHHPGASPEYQFADIPADVWGTAKVVLATSYPLLNHFRPDEFAMALGKAKAQGAITALDIGPLLGEPVTLDELKTLLPVVDYLIANERELAACAGEQGAEALVEQGAACVVVKQGKDGAHVYRQENSFHVAGFPVEARVTVGAGDSFNAGFLFALGRGDSLGNAVRFGNATASVVVESGRSVLCAPTVEQVEARMRGSA